MSKPEHVLESRIAIEKKTSCTLERTKLGANGNQAEAGGSRAGIS
jgi:hypothetical protein